MKVVKRGTTRHRARARLRHPAGRAHERRRRRACASGRAPADATRQYRPIDIFFRSLAEDQRDRAIGVVLSGTRLRRRAGPPRRSRPPAGSRSRRTPTTAAVRRHAARRDRDRRRRPRAAGRRRSPRSWRGSAAHPSSARPSDGPTRRSPPTSGCQQIFQLLRSGERRRLHALQVADASSAASSGAWRCTSSRASSDYVALPASGSGRGRRPVRGHPDPRHAASSASRSRSRRCERGRPRRLAGRSAAARPAPRLGARAARRARRPTRSRWSARAARRRARSAVPIQSSAPTSASRDRAARAPASIPRASRPTSRPSGCAASSPRRRRLPGQQGVRDLCVFARQDLTRDPPFSARPGRLPQRADLPRPRCSSGDGVFHYALKPTAS